jgi:plasmid stabilization system protein ParE
MARVVFTLPSKEDLEKIVRYTRDTWGSGQAVEYVSGLRKQANLLAQTPEVGKSRDDLEGGLICFPFLMSVMLFTTQKLLMVSPLSAFFINTKTLLSKI